MTAGFRDWKDQCEWSGYHVEVISLEGHLALAKSQDICQTVMPMYHIWKNDKCIASTPMLDVAMQIYQENTGGNEMPSKKKAETVPQEAPAAAINVDVCKEEIRARMLKTGREGVEDLLAYMEEHGFYSAPASSRYHLHVPGGLAQHTVNVLHAADKIAVALIGGKNMTDELRNSIGIVCICHDVGKMGDFKKSYYTDNILKTTGKRSDSSPYKRNPELYDFGHASTSALICRMFIDFTPEEQVAVMCHDGYEDPVSAAMLRQIGTDSIPPLLMILHWADMWAAHVIEDGTANKEEKGE